MVLVSRLAALRSNAALSRLGALRPMAVQVPQIRTFMTGPGVSMQRPQEVARPRHSSYPGSMIMTPAASSIFNTIHRHPFHTTARVEKEEEAAAAEAKGPTAEEIQTIDDQLFDACKHNDKMYASKTCDWVDEQSVRDVTAAHAEQLIRFQTQELEKTGVRSAAARYAAKKEVLAMYNKNMDRNHIYSSPYIVIGTAAASQVFLSPFMIFDLDWVAWTNEKFVTMETPPPHELDTWLEVGNWAWNWGEPVMGTVQYMLFWYAFMEFSAQSMDYAPYMDSAKRRRAERLCKLFPQYPHEYIRDFSRGSGLRPGSWSLFAIVAALLLLSYGVGWLALDGAKVGKAKRAKLAVERLFKAAKEIDEDLTEKEFLAAVAEALEDVGDNLPEEYQDKIKEDLNLEQDGEKKSKSAYQFKPAMAAYEAELQKIQKEVDDAYDLAEKNSFMGGTFADVFSSSERASELDNLEAKASSKYFPEQTEKQAGVVQELFKSIPTGAKSKNDMVMDKQVKDFMVKFEHACDADGLSGDEKFHKFEALFKEDIVEFANNLSKQHAEKRMNRQPTIAN